MTFYTFTTGLTALLSLLLGAFVYYNNPKSPLHKAWFDFAFSIAVWAFGYFLTLTDWFTHDISLLCSRFSHASGAFIPILFFNFVSILLEETERHKKLIKFGYFISFLMYFMCFTPLVVKDVTEKLNIKYYPEWGILYPLYALLYYIYAGYGTYRMYAVCKDSVGEKRNKIKYFLLAAFIGFSGGVSLFFLILNIKIPPFASVLIALYPILTSYGILRHHFLDIEVIIKRAAVFAGLFASVYLVFAFFALLGQLFFEKFITTNRWVAMIPSVVVVTFMLRPLENFLISVTDKFLFQKKYDYKELLKTFTGEVLTVLDLSKLVNLTAENLSKIIRLESCAVLIYDKEKDNYPVSASLGLKEQNLVFDKTTHLINYLFKTHHYLLKDKTIAGLPDVGTVKEDLKKLNTELVIPIILHNDLMGALALGRKKSGEDFIQDDMDILLPLSQTLAVAISNAQYFLELGKTQAEAAQREKMAVIGTLAAGINHEICNPLGIARGQCEAFLLNKRDGLYNDKLETEQLSEALRIMELVIKETDRATSITKKLSTFAKPSKGEGVDDVDISKELDEVIALVGYELKLDKIELIKNIPPALPHIHADKKQIQEIFFNLIRNAAQAISESGKITVSARVDGVEAGTPFKGDGDTFQGDGDTLQNSVSFSREECPQSSSGKVSPSLQEYPQSSSRKVSPSIVEISIQDTGCGIPEDKLGMIFNPFYTTKEPGKGTGLGLFIVRQVVERNKGRISLKSKVGEGTTFTLEFPVSN